VKHNRHESLKIRIFPSGFPRNILYAYLICPMRVTCSVHLILLDLITVIINGEEYN